MTVTTTSTTPAAVADLSVSTSVKALLDALAFVREAICKRPPMAVLLGVKLEAAAGTLTVSAFDYETSCTDRIDGAGSGAALVPGAILRELLRALDTGQVTLTVVGAALEVSQGETTLSLPLLALADYPALPVQADTAVAVLPGSALVELNRVGFAAGRDDTLPVLTAVQLEFAGAEVRAIATDRYRLAISTLQLSCGTHEMLVPASALSLMARALGTAEQVSLALLGHDLLEASTSTRRITTRLQEGSFPRYRSLLPEARTDALVRVAVPATLKAVKQVSVALSHDAPVRLTGEAGRMLLSAGTADDISARSSVPAVGAEFSLTAMKPKFFTEALTAIAAKGEVDLQPSGTKPMLIIEAGDTERRFVVLQMPVRVS